MKIAIISFYNGHLERGAENWVNELSKRLSKFHKIVIFQNEEFIIDWTKSAEGSIRRLFFLDYRSLLIARFTLGILPILWRENYEVIVPVNGGWQSILIRIITWLKRSKMMIVGHSGRGWDDRFNLWTFPDLFVCLTKFSKVWAKRINPFIKIEYIPNGVNLKQFNSKGKKISIKLKRPIVLCVGAFSNSKRIDLTIKAIVLVKGASLLLVGKGDLEGELKDLGQKLLGDRFCLTSYPYFKMSDVYRAADVFTLCSWENEAFPLVYLEALASNLPVVATDDDVRREIVGIGGILVNPENTKEYAKAIRSALYYKWDDKPREQAEKFTWEKISKQYDELLLNMLRLNK